jgi:ParB family transcriptional regulator, chromosome partitioning protein
MALPRRRFCSVVLPTAADWLNVSESWLSRMLKVAQPPDAVIPLFADPTELSMRAAYPLAAFCADSDKRRIALNRVHKIEDEQQRRDQTGAALLGAAEIIRQLLQGVDAGGAELAGAGGKAVSWCWREAG